MHDLIQLSPGRLPVKNLSLRAFSTAACLLLLAACNARGEASAQVTSAASASPVPAAATVTESTTARARPTPGDAAPATTEALVVVGPGGAVEPW